MSDKMMDINHLKPGDNHYRAFIGPPAQYDLVAAMVFSLLTILGLREHHKVLDIGCGSLRVGRLLIPYLGQGNYYGIEPNEWLVRDGIKYEIGDDLIRLKKPSLFFSDSLAGHEEKINFDFAFAQSIFSHSSKKIINRWLEDVKHHMSESGVFLATYLSYSKDYQGEMDWTYPACVYYRDETIKKLAQQNGLCFQRIPWGHPRQVWGAFYNSSFNTSSLRCEELNWNNYLKKNFGMVYPVQDIQNEYKKQLILLKDKNEQKVIEFDGVKSELQQREIELITIYNTRGWKFLSILKKLYAPIRNILLKRSKK